jgi:hypothetical protein
MILPRYKNRHRLIVKICKECNHEYLGHPISKYCPKHQNIQNRKPKPKKFKRFRQINRIIKSKEFDVKDKLVQCGLKGCTNFFIIRVYPRQELYPKFCPEHRTEWKRLYFKQRRKL